MSQIAFLLSQKLCWGVITIILLKRVTLIDAALDRWRLLSILILLPLLLLGGPLIFYLQSLFQSEVLIQFFLFLLGLLSSLFCHLLFQNDLLLLLFVQTICHLLPRLKIRHFHSLELLRLHLIKHLGDWNLRNLVLPKRLR